MKCKRHKYIRNYEGSIVTLLCSTCGYLEKRIATDGIKKGKLLFATK